MESNFDILAKLCFQDVMAGVGKWEAGGDKGGTSYIKSKQ